MRTLGNGLVWLIAFLRSVEPQVVPVIQSDSLPADISEYVRENSIYLARVSPEVGRVTVRWQVTDMFFWTFGWGLVFFCVVGVTAALAGAILRDLNYVVTGALMVLQTMLMSRMLVLMYRPRLRTVLRKSGL